jgi:hypothetical protein
MLPSYPRPIRPRDGGERFSEQQWGRRITEELHLAPSPACAGVGAFLARAPNAPALSSDAGWSSSTVGGAARGGRRFFSLSPPRRTTTSAKLRRTRSGGSGELSGEHGPRRRWIRGWRRCWPLPPSPSSRRPWHEAVVTDPSPTSHGCEPEGGCGGGSSSYGRVREREQLQRWLVRTRSRGLFAPASAVCPAPARQALPADPA